MLSDVQLYDVPSSKRYGRLKPTGHREVHLDHLGVMALGYRDVDFSTEEHMNMGTTSPARSASAVSLRPAEI